jgi:hypothetical protein
VKACLLVQVGEVNNAHAGAQRDDVTTPLLHGSRQIVKVVPDVVRLIVRNFALVDLTKTKKKLDADSAQEQNADPLLEILKGLSDASL